MASVRWHSLWLVLITSFLGVVSAAVAADPLVFWSSGYGQGVQDDLQEAILPEFARAHGTTIEYAEIGWGSARDERLMITAAGGVGPDVYVNGTHGFALPLDEYVAGWAERDRINPAFWEVARWMSNGELLYVPQLAEIRGVAYNARLFMDAGLSGEAPNGWREISDAVRRLTHLDGNGRVVQSGFETTWHAPYVANEFDWIIQQAGEAITSPDFKTSRIQTPAGLSAVEYMIELYQTTHPDGYAPLNEAAFGNGSVAMVRGLVSAKQRIEQNSPADLPYFGLFAPRMDASTQPVAPAFVNGLSIASASRQPDLAWNLIVHLLSVEAQTQFVAAGSTMVVRQEVATMSGLDAVSYLMPWYDISSFAAPIGVLGNRSALARILVDALNRTISPEEAILRMSEEHQLALDRLYGEG